MEKSCAFREPHQVGFETKVRELSVERRGQKGGMQGLQGPLGQLDKHQKEIIIVHSI